MAGVSTEHVKRPLLDVERSLDCRVGRSMDAIQFDTADVLCDFTLESFLLKETEPHSLIKKWIPERVDDDEANDTDGEAKKKWYDLHAVHRRLVAKEHFTKASSELHGNVYVERFSIRMKDLVNLMYAQRLDGALDSDSEMVWDLSQNCGRVPCGSGLIPCALPKGRPWLVCRARPLLGVESMLLQGAHVQGLPALRESVWSNGFLQDLSGNAFCVPAFTTWLLSILSAMQPMPS